MRARCGVGRKSETPTAESAGGAKNYRTRFRSLVALADGAAEADLSVVDADVEAAVRVGADPRLVGDRRAVAAVVGQRYEQSLVALAALGILLVIRHVHPLPSAVATAP